MGIPTDEVQSLIGRAYAELSEAYEEATAVEDLQTRPIQPESPLDIWPLVSEHKMNLWCAS